MDKDQKEAMQVCKEVIVKFIECGRVTPANFSEIFPAVYGVILNSIKTTEGDDVSGAVQ